MLLKKITLQNFRNYPQSDFSFHPLLTIVIGANAQGKTNILEAIYFLLNGTGFREAKEVELITINETNSIVQGEFLLEDHLIQLQIALKMKENLIDKIFMVNKAIKKYYQYITETTRSILFSPDQLNIITGSPDNRRSYINSVISYYDKEYKKRLNNYENGLRRRNKIMEFYKEESSLREELAFWDNYLIEQAEYITLKRQNYINYLNNHQKILDTAFEIEYLKNEINQQRLGEVYEQEKKQRRTLIGPQKDDFILYQHKDYRQNIHLFGSRSEQRLGVYWLQHNEALYCEEFLKKKPIILLDDIFSELDTTNKKLVLQMVSQYQTILTTTEKEVLELTHMDKEIIQL